MTVRRLFVFAKGWIGVDGVAGDTGSERLLIGVAAKPALAFSHYGRHPPHSHAGSRLAGFLSYVLFLKVGQ